MELTPKQQVIERVRESKNVLVLTHQNPDGDALGSILALEMFLSGIGKNTLAVCNDAAPETFTFLPNVSKIAQNFSGARDFVISIDTSQVKAEKIMYRSEGGKLNIVVTPKNGQFMPEMVEFPEGRFNFDLIIVLDTPDLERVGTPFEKNPDVFYETPVINIDHHASNDNFGKINLVDLTATSTAEILVSVMEALSPDKSPFTEDIATALLTGIITDTGSFQNANTTPKSLTVAAQLVAAGARREEIIKRIFKTRNLSTLRLWGRALVNLRDEKGDGFVWTSLRKQDFMEVGASEAESSGVIDELLKSVSGADFVMLLSEKGTSVMGSLRSVKPSFDVTKTAAIFNGGGHALAAGFELKNTTLSESSKMIVQRIRETKRAMNGKMSGEESE
jgi:phosphoesterase RecJ-like protein